MLACCLAVWILGPRCGTHADEGAPGRISIAAFEDLVSTHERTVESFRIEGVVCAVASERNLIVLQDEATAVLVESPALRGNVRVGDHLAVLGRNCAVQRRQATLHLGAASTVDLDGIHSAVTKCGVARLKAGLQPIRLAWFNGRGDSALRLEYEGMGIPRQRIPDRLLRHKTLKDGDIYEPGLDFAAYNGEGWSSLPDFARLVSVATGVATNFDRSYSVHRENTGLVFSGYIEVPDAGVYTFYLESDDGARLQVGDPADSCEVIVLEGRGVPKAKRLEEALSNRNQSQWVETEGTVIFAAEDMRNLRLDVRWRGDLLRVTVLDGASLASDGQLMQRRVRLTGICEALRNLAPLQTVRITVPSARQIVLEDAPPAGPQGPTPAILTTADQVHGLTLEDADRHIHVSMRGVVTWAADRCLMLQDATGGVFVNLENPIERPAVGDFWEAEGRTERGGFAPDVLAAKMTFLGHAGLPDPIHASWDQLMNGSLTTQYVEIEGVLTAATDTTLSVMTREGNIEIIRDDPGYPLPQMLTPAARAEAYLGSVLRFRGALSAARDRKTRRATSGVIRLGSALVSVEEPRPVDPFSIPAKAVADLLLFDPHAKGFRRTKLAGQIIHAAPGVYFMQQGEAGVRLLTKEPLPLRSGDLVEAVGFPRLDGLSTVLEEAEVRVTGKGALPPPAMLAAKELPNPRRDATLVHVEATLLAESALRGDRLLELQAGPNRFVGRLSTASDPGPPLRIGSRLQLVGAYAWAPQHRSGKEPVGLELLLEAPQAITVLQAGPWWTEQRVVAAAAALASALGLAMIWITLLRRKVDERTGQLRQEIGERQRAEQRRAMEAERARVAQDLHDELGTGLTQVGMLGALAGSAATSAEKRELYLAQLTNTARSLVEDLDEIVWAVNPEHDSAAALWSYVSFFGQEFLNLAGIECYFEISEPSPDIPMDSKLRHGIFLAAKEALNNVVRHSGASEVHLSFAVVEHTLMATISDNGRGFGENGLAPGSDGLSGMRRRLQSMGGECQVQSRPGHGTEVKFLLPLEGGGK